MMIASSSVIRRLVLLATTASSVWTRSSAQTQTCVAHLEPCASSEECCDGLSCSPTMGTCQDFEVDYGADCESDADCGGSFVCTIVGCKECLGYLDCEDCTDINGDCQHIGDNLSCGAGTCHQCREGLIDCPSGEYCNNGFFGRRKTCETCLPVGSAGCVITDGVAAEDINRICCDGSVCTGDGVCADCGSDQDCDDNFGLNTKRSRCVAGRCVGCASSDECTQYGLLEQCSENGFCVPCQVNDEGTEFYCERGTGGTSHTFDGSNGGGGDGGGGPTSPDTGDGSNGGDGSSTGPGTGDGNESDNSGGGSSGKTETQLNLAVLVCFVTILVSKCHY